MIRRDRATGWLRALHWPRSWSYCRLWNKRCPTAVLRGVFSVGGGELRPLPVKSSCCRRCRWRGKRRPALAPASF